LQSVIKPVFSRGSAGAPFLAIDTGLRMGTYIADSLILNFGICLYFKSSCLMTAFSTACP